MSPCRCTSDLLGLTDLVRGQLSEQDRLTLGALITIDVHARDVVQELTDAGEEAEEENWLVIFPIVLGCAAPLPISERKQGLEVLLGLKGW